MAQGIKSRALIQNTYLVLNNSSFYMTVIYITSFCNIHMFAITSYITYYIMFILHLFSQSNY